LFEQPSHFPAPHYKFENFDLTESRVELGRKIFYDPILSSDNSISCASCHDKAHGFSDPGLAFSYGVNDSITARHSPSLANLAWNTSFMWDGGVNHIEIMSFAPITNPNEMNEDMSNVVEKIKADPAYQFQFDMAFGQESIRDQTILWALASYMSVMVSADAKYDKVITGKASFSTEEKKGYILFQRDCAACHSEPLTTNFSFQNNGIDSVFNDIGRERISMSSEDKGKFKVPSLRNVALSAPYMHDGRFNSLAEVINHYSDGIVESNTLNSSLSGGFNYTQEEKSAIEAFLNTLTDYAFITNEKL
jgi:cytochrome c peroxidase